MEMNAYVLTFICKRKTLIWHAIIVYVIVAISIQAIFEARQAHQFYSNNKSFNSKPFMTLPFLSAYFG